MSEHKPRRTVNLLYAALIYLLSLLLLLSLLYGFLSSNGFNEKNFLIGAGGISLIALGIGYILSSDLLSPKWEMDAKFAHLSKEILHELNIPLSTIDANAKMLKKTHADEKSQRRLDRIDAASVRLKRLYDELVYTINKEVHTIEKEHFSLSALLEERVEVLRGFGRNPFVLTASDLSLFADKIGFEQMIDNLLNNAMKYSDKSSLIKITTEGETVLVQDSGIGMDEAELVRIFDRYYQTDESQKGEGIGLALVRAYCDEARIGIVILSEPGKGTTVKLDLKQIVVASNSIHDKLTGKEEED
ncbi:MAG: HAMP domain-containing sensor histidine kinase [Campylobacterota bacterium]|nr:HAMP domain-containing sensor histidine kinase [Campylobacterota bacterium]